MASSSPRAIVRLEESVVNRIAAGEVIGRPANAIKELLENCIDAGATSIKISVKDGGAKLLQIQDNGCGIRKDDLPILCERFTTSKIRKFDDLSSLRTYGFRGEALASISHVSHLTITTKTRDEAVGWRAHYLDGKLVPAPGATSAEPRPAASNDGTTITAEDLFYNVPQRRKGLGSASDEYNRILDVVTKYAIHNEGVGISLKKMGSNSADVTTSASASSLDTIGQLQNEALRKALVRLECAEASSGDKVGFKCEGWVSNAHWHGKKSNCMIFINHRLVDCAPLKKALEGTYATILPKGTFPFLYVSLEIAPEHVDPNVHPNKREVRFVGEDEIIDRVCEGLAKVLEGTSGSRMYTVQTLLPGASGFVQAGPSRASGFGSHTTASSSRAGPSLSKLPPQKLVRTDPTARTLDALLSRTTATAPRPSGSGSPPARKRRKGTEGEPMQIDSEGEDELAEGAGRGEGTLVRNGGTGGGGVDPVTQMAKIPESACSLTSIKTLRKRLKERKHPELEEVVKRHISVGVVDVAKGCTCWQHETALYLITHLPFCEELFYQLGLRQFGALPRFVLQPAPPLRKLVELAVAREWEARRDAKLEEIGLEAAIEKICDVLLSRKDMLDEYFSLSFDDDGNVSSIPVLLPGYRPNLEKLPLFFMRMAVHCDWTDELRCFDTFLHELAFFYLPTLLPSSSGSSDETAVEAEGEIKAQLDHVVFPAMKSYLVPSGELVQAAVRVTTLPELYKVFERC